MLEPFCRKDRCFSSIHQDLFTETYSNFIIQLCNTSQLHLCRSNIQYDRTRVQGWGLMTIIKDRIDADMLIRKNRPSLNGKSLPQSQSVFYKKCLSKLFPKNIYHKMTQIYIDIPKYKLKKYFKHYLTGNKIKTSSLSTP